MQVAEGFTTKTTKDKRSKVKDDWWVLLVADPGWHRIENPSKKQRWCFSVRVLCVVVVKLVLSSRLQTCNCFVASCAHALHRSAS
jgi:hypothetical protein